MLCMLCLKNVDKLIYTFSEYGFRLNVCSIISKHFWLKPNRENRTIETVCHVCWKQLYSFHIFYERIRKVHDKLVDILSEKSGNKTSSPVQHNGSLSPETIALIDEGEQPTTKVSEQQNKSNLNSEIDGLSDEQKLQTPAQNENGQFKWRTSLCDEEIKLDIESEILSAEVSKVSTQQTRTETGNIISESPVANRENRLDVNGLPNNLNKPQIRCREFDSIIQKNINLVCNICSKPLESFFILKEHYSSVHNEVGYAVCCKKNFYSRHTLVHHILVHQDPKFFKCDQCGKVLANKRSLKNHTKTHTLAIRNFKCKKCEHSFTRKEKLDSHMQRHMKPEKICEKCGKLTRTLKEHQLREHSKEPRQRVQCPVCNAKLADNSSLHTHLKYQHPKTETLQHVCKICGKISSSGYGLKRHIVYMHKCERRHKCTLCGKAFKAAQILREHMSTHTGEVLYTCPHCPKTFNSNANMHSHRKKMHRKEWEENRRYPHMVAASQINRLEQVQ